VSDPALLAELRRDEGVVRHAYQDSLGFWTIGVGRLIDRRRGGGLSDAEIDLLLANDVARVEAGLDARIPWWRTLDPVRRRVLANMGFNLGVEGLLGFRNTLPAVREGRYEDAADGMLRSKWARQVGARAVRLAAMMREGSPRA
jgi:lysozyme